MGDVPAADRVGESGGRDGPVRRQTRIEWRAFGGGNERGQHCSKRPQRSVPPRVPVHASSRDVDEARFVREIERGNAIVGFNFDMALPAFVIARDEQGNRPPVCLRFDRQSRTATLNIKRTEREIAELQFANHRHDVRQHVIEQRHRRIVALGLPAADIRSAVGPNQPEALRAAERGHGGRISLDISCEQKHVAGSKRSTVGFRDVAEFLDPPAATGRPAFRPVLEYRSSGPSRQRRNDRPPDLPPPRHRGAPDRLRGRPGVHGAQPATELRLRSPRLEACCIAGRMHGDAVGAAREPAQHRSNRSRPTPAADDRYFHRYRPNDPQGFWQPGAWQSAGGKRDHAGKAHPGLPPAPTFDKRAPIRKVTMYFRIRGFDPAIRAILACFTWISNEFHNCAGE